MARKLRRVRKTRKITKRTKRRTTVSKKGAFGGYKICFKGRHDTLERVFGNRPLAPSAMTKKLWTYVKARKLYNY